MADKPSLVEQLRGATRLAVVATRRVTDLVEKMHHTIGGGPDLLGRPLEGITKLLTAPTYGTIRGVTEVVGAGLDYALSQLAPLLERAGAERGPVLAILNGVLGDYLEETKNPLAVRMALCHGGEALDLTKEALAAKFPAGDRLLVLVHGSCADELCWLRNGQDYGAGLAREFGLVPLQLRYNSGLHVSQNGREFSGLLERLVTSWPRPVRAVVLVAHSMGGLVCRGACHVAEREGHAWRKALRALVMVGTPHHGAPLERGGNWVDVALGVSRYSAPLAKLGRLRSAGITDLRYGAYLDEHWQGRDRFEPGEDPRGPMQLPQGVECFAIAATTAAEAAPALPGDGLVPIDSALGRHADPARHLGFDEAHTAVVFGTPHIELVGSAAVYEKLVQFLAPVLGPACAT